MRKALFAGAVLVLAALVAACGTDSTASSTNEPVAPEVPDTTSSRSQTDGRWIGAWAAAPSDAADAYADQSLRLVVTPLRGGDVARVRLSNRFGAAPIAVRSVHLGRQETGARLAAGSNRPVEFDGQAEVTIPAGAEVVSDAVEFPFDAFEHVAVSLFVPAPGGLATRHYLAKQTSFVSESGGGDRSAEESGEGFATTIVDRPFVVGLDVRVDGCVGVVAAIGDSITDGDQRDSEDNELGIDEDARYPDFLARRLSAAGEEFPVLNLGIGGNRILRDSGSLISLYGPSLLNRLDADLLARDDVTDVILLEGINDLAMPPWPGAVEIIDGLEAAVDALKAARGDGPEIRVLVGTITPAGGTAGPLGVFYWATESRRQEINEYLRTVGIGDGTVDFDAAVRDPADPTLLAPECDGGDGLHPGAEGYERMADAVDLDALAGCDDSD